MSEGTKQKLPVLLKLISVNNTYLSKNAHVQNKFWEAIAGKLNNLGGMQMHAKDWRAIYCNWRQNISINYKEAVQNLIKDLPDDDYFTINITNDATDKVENNSVSKQPSGSGAPTREQTKRLNELIWRHINILTSDTCDEHLKNQTWLNITTELNNVPNGALMLPKTWKNYVDFQKFKRIQNMKRARDQNEPQGDDFQDIINSTEINTNAEINGGFENVDDIIYEEVENLSDDLNPNNLNTIECCIENNEQEDIDELTATNSDNSDSDDDEFHAINNNIKKTPIVKTFSHTKNMSKNIKRLQHEIKDVKDSLKKIINSVTLIAEFVQEHYRKQNEANILLKRNNELLKMLVTDNRNTKRST